ncbi:hypothetical protein BD626DRAFT_627589 [Schizophyllum amplum]|uniref:Uncharacterized protein n=1 Tax=Schizophyllum amplum TaxID=97359 RepID=A0A550CQU7_9AGAR|nr:hypothetical protein BD626DRAFT_627589 [Auriculariopsis ampla]
MITSVLDDARQQDEDWQLVFLAITILMRASSSSSRCDRVKHYSSTPKWLNVSIPKGESVSLLFPPQSSTDQRVHTSTSAAPTSHEAEYEYIGTKMTGGGRNILQRVEDMRWNLNIKSFGPEHIICAGCGRAVSTRSRSGIYQDNLSNWKYHQKICSSLREWWNPDSPGKFTAEMQDEHERSRKASKDLALDPFEQLHHQIFTPEWLNISVPKGDAANPTAGRGHGASPALTQQQIERQGWLTTAEAYRGLNLSTQPHGSSPAASCGSASTFGHSTFTGTPAYTSSSSSGTYSSSSSSNAYSSSSSSSAYMSSASFSTYPASAGGYPPSFATPTHTSSGNSPFDLRQASFSTTRSSFESEQATARGLSSVSSSPLPPLRSSTDQRVRPKIHTVSDSSGIEYMYIGTQAFRGRNVLERVADMSANPNIKAFAVHQVVCACNVTMTNNMWEFNDTTWRDHASSSRCLWKNRPSSYREEMQAELSSSRRVSRDRALAYLKDKKLVEKV